MNNLINTNTRDENSTTSSSVIDNPIFKMKSVSIMNNNSTGSRLESNPTFGENIKNIEGKIVLVEKSNGKKFYGLIIKTQRDSQNRVKSYIIKSRKTKKVYTIAPEYITVVDQSQVEGGAGLSNGLEKILTFNDWEQRVDRKKERVKPSPDY